MKRNCGIVLLAAGASSRLGVPKQTLLFNKSTLLEHSINEALSTIVDEVVVVLGASAKIIQPAIQNKKLSFVVNEHWQDGMASSIRCGLQYLLQKQPALEAVLLMACDQPYISTAILDKLVTLQESSGSPIVASNYAGTKGIPAVFAKRIFPDVLTLEGDTGAKRIIMKHGNSVESIDFPGGEMDIDTNEDYLRMQESNKS